MQKNLSYEDYTLPVYEEIQLQNKAAEPTDVRVERISSSFAKKTKKPKCIALVSLLAIAMVAAIALSAYAVVDSNQDMENLMMDFQELQVELNETKEASKTEIAKLKIMLQNSIHTANNAIMTQLNSLQSSVSSLNTTNEATVTQLNSLQSSVSSLNTTNGATMTQLNSLQSSVSSLNTTNGVTMTQLNSTQSSVNSLTTRVNSPVNLYQNCTQETQSCTSTQSGSAYRRFCTTSFLPVNKSGYYTLSMACKYDPAPQKLDTSTLRQDGSDVHCLCETASFVSSTGAHLFSNIPAFTCTLVITRCPTSQNIV